MRRLTRLLIALSTAAVPVTTCSVPAQADPEISSAWVRVTCAGTTVDQVCHIRIPGGFRRLDVTYVHGGQRLGFGSTWDYDQPRRRAPQRSMLRHKISPVVSVDCQATGSRVACTVWIQGRVDSYRDTYWSAGANLGGMTMTELTTPTTRSTR